MPCNSDYLNPTYRERELQRAARCLLYLLGESKQKIPATLPSAAQDIYCRSDWVPRLCDEMKAMGAGGRESFFSSRFTQKGCRELMDWWEEHEAADRLREEREREDVNREKIIKRAKSKLSLEERAVLGID